MGRAGEAIGLALVALAGLTACKPAPSRHAPAAPPPTAASAPARVARSVYAAKVTPGGPGVWTYVVSGKADGADARFEAVRFRTSADLHDCDLKAADSDPSQQAAISRPGATGLRAASAAGTPWRSVRLVLSCPGRPEGLVSLVVSDATGALHERIVVGPVAGPAR